MNFLRADDRVRTGDLNLGKVPRYQLRYVRIFTCEGAIYLKGGVANQSELVALGYVRRNHRNSRWQEPYRCGG